MLDEDILEYPFNVKKIFSKKRALKRELQENLTPHQDVKIAVMGGSTTSEIKNILELFLLKNHIKPIFYESQYNRYYEEAIFENATLKEFNPDIVLIHTTSKNILNLPGLNDSKELIKEKMEGELARYQAIWSKLHLQFNCAIVQNNFELPRDRQLGNMDFTSGFGKTNFIMKLNMEFAVQAERTPYLFINDINYLSSWFGLERWHDIRFWYSYKYALNYDAIPLLAHNISKIIDSIYGKTQKALVVDLDNTLWGGVIGDDGLGGIEIGQDTPKGEAHMDFQEYLKDLKNRGVILNICSKNDLENALEGLNHPGNILKPDDFQIIKANWEHKPQNIISIAKELNIGLESLVFIDDNPTERDMVKKQLPQVKVPDIGNNVEQFIEYVDRGSWFETTSLSSEDFKRNAYYKGNKEREVLQNQCLNYADFLKSLQMKAEIANFKPINSERIAQLINKTNQFNLTTRRYNLAEVEKMATDVKFITIYGKLLDKFGDNGVISVLVGKVEGNILEILIWLMSCRVLQREFENAMMDFLIGECQNRNIKEIIGTYIKTKKNSLVESHYQKMGFDLVEKNEDASSTWKYLIDDSYKEKNNFIEIID
jgi:FkbH-like protein